MSSTRFKMIYERLKIGWELSVFFAKLVNHGPELAKVIERHLPALQRHAEQFKQAGEQALDRFLKGELGFDDIWKLITSFWDSVVAQAGSLGATVADKLQTWFLGRARPDPSSRAAPAQASKTPP